MTVLTKVKDYQKNNFSIQPQILSKINERWKFAFDYFGYEMKK